MERRKKINKHKIKYVLFQEVTNDIKNIEYAEGEKRGLRQGMFMSCLCYLGESWKVSLIEESHLN